MTVASQPGPPAPRNIYTDGYGTPIGEAIEAPHGVLVWGRSPLAAGPRMVSLGIVGDFVAALQAVASHERSMATRAPRPVRQIGTYDGTLPDGICIAGETNPWIEVDGAVVGWPQAELRPDPANDCEACAGEPLPGVLAHDEVGVQCCDACGRFEGDLPAALALAALVGGAVRYEQEPRR